MAKIYVMLSYPNSIPSKAIKAYTHKPYSHTSLSLDESLDVLYSFGRKGMYNLLNAGFIREKIGKGVLGRRNTQCMVCAFEVTPEQKEEMRRIIEDISEHKEEYKYNFAGFFANVIHKYPVYEKKFVCSQFVAYVLETAGVDALGKPYVQVRPEDFRICPNKEVVYEGGMNDYPYREIHEDNNIAV